MSVAEDVVAAGQRLSELGLSPGTSGNISARDGDRIVMTPTGSDMGALEAADLSVLSFDGELLSGGKASKEFPFHRAMYRRDSGTTAVVHLHSPHAAAISCTPAWSERSAIPPLTPYFVMRSGQTPLIAYASPGDPSQADRMERLPFPFNAALLQNHGSVAAGNTMADAIAAAVELEEVCRLMLLLGDRPLTLLPEGEAEHLAEKYGSYWTAQ
ncbi:aldolase [Curtobacterium sp. MCSS17_011]|uniref:class II aldolase/adducin family protein n=1 Tax=Curtobacterium sp. MCSS17_011 TaxID=2175643 RepID=UPI000D834640|nr:class II aldolase/adducin family protein [Curtobacterium sp. MCSS17_011]PYY53186.1 aldolase [Curtobacterium sp. MCSS17_011]